MVTDKPDSLDGGVSPDRKSTRLNSSDLVSSYAVFCLKKTICFDTDVGLSEAQIVPLAARSARHVAPASGAAKAKDARAGPLGVLTYIFFFFFNNPAPTEIHPLPPHDALPI